MSTVDMPNPFHLAIPVHDLESAREFYGGLLQCPEGRSDERWIDFNFYGHQLVCHLDAHHSQTLLHNPVDDHDVPVPHFGLVMQMKDWQQLADRLQLASVSFVIEPYIRFAGKPAEQATMFLLDPSGNALEFKAFKDIDSQLFQR
jgi:extradiol dioxygenase family protein